MNTVGGRPESISERTIMATIIPKVRGWHLLQLSSLRYLLASYRLLVCGFPEPGLPPALRRNLAHLTIS